MEEWSYLDPQGFVAPAELWAFTHSHGVANHLSVEGERVRITWRAPAPVMEELRALVKEILPPE
jgi:hypothetical protein